MEQTAVEWLYNNLLPNPISNEDIEYNEAVFENAKVLDAQQKRSYNEEEVFELLQNFNQNAMEYIQQDERNIMTSVTLKKWFNKFKKK